MRVIVYELLQIELPLYRFVDVYNPLNNNRSLPPNVIDLLRSQIFKIAEVYSRNTLHE